MKIKYFLSLNSLLYRVCKGLKSIPFFPIPLASPPLGTPGDCPESPESSETVRSSWTPPFPLRTAHLTSRHTIVHPFTADSGVRVSCTPSKFLRVSLWILPCWSVVYYFYVSLPLIILFGSPLLLEWLASGLQGCPYIRILSLRTEVCV